MPGGERDAPTPALGQGRRGVCPAEPRLHQPALTLVRAGQARAVAPACTRHRPAGSLVESPTAAGPYVVTSPGGPGNIDPALDFAGQPVVVHGPARNNRGTAVRRRALLDDHVNGAPCAFVPGRRHNAERERARRAARFRPVPLGAAQCRMRDYFGRGADFVAVPHSGQTVPGARSRRSYPHSGHRPLRRRLYRCTRGGTTRKSHQAPAKNSVFASKPSQMGEIGRLPYV